MRPMEATLLAEGSHRDLLEVQREIGIAVRLSIDAVTFETLPQEMGLLLIRLALAEVLRDAVAKDADETDATGRQ
jgi:hypothetical protein